MICSKCKKDNPKGLRYCTTCDALLPDGVHTPVPRDNVEQDVLNSNNGEFSVLSETPVRLVLLLICVIVPFLGIILGLLTSLTPFEQSKELSSKMIRWACMASIIWLCLTVVVGLIIVETANYFV